MTRVQERLGRGLAFPLAPDVVRGHLRYRTGSEKVRESIELILLTEPGERVMRPAFGCGLRQFLMEPNTVATRARIKRVVERSLTRFEPRIILDEVAVTPGDDPALVLIAIRYEHELDGSGDVLVYPLYLETT